MRIPFLVERLKRFFAKDDASMLLEFIILLPLIIWAYAGMYVFWDAYKAQNVSVKAAYTISDLISRADVPLTDAGLNRMHQMTSFLNYDKHPVRLRVSFVDMEEDSAGNPVMVLDGRSVVRGPDPVAPFDELQEEPFREHTSMDALEPHIPIMAVGDQVIVVETELDYTPLFRFRLAPMNPLILETLVVTRPRNGGSIGFDDDAALAAAG